VSLARALWLSTHIEVTRASAVEHERAALRLREEMKQLQDELMDNVAKEMSNGGGPKSEDQLRMLAGMTDLAIGDQAQGGSS
jgi:hypothetical protein